MNTLLPIKTLFLQNLIKQRSFSSKDNSSKDLPYILPLIKYDNADVEKIKIFSDNRKVFIVE